MFKKVKFFSGKELEEWQKKGLVLLTNKLKVLRNTKFCFFFLILISVNILSAQKLHIKNYTTDDGLPTAQVWCSLQDSKGYMWFGTSGGLVRFDGVEFVVYTVEDGLISNIIASLLEDNGILWVTTYNGISKFDGNSFKNYTEKDGLGKGVVRSVAKFKDCLWFGTREGGLSRFDGKNFVNYTTEDGLPNNTIYSLLSDGEYLWIGTTGGGLSRFDGKAFNNFSEKDGISAKVIRGLTKKNSTIWIGTQDEGMFKYERGKFLKVSDLPHHDFFCGAEDEGLWFGTLGNGVWRFKDGFRNYTMENGLINDRIYSILIDRENSVWFCTENGISKLLSTKFISYLENKMVLSICRFKNATWFGTSAFGLSKLEDDKLTSYTVKDGLLSDEIWALSVFKDKLWVATYKGLNSFDGKKFQSYTAKEGLVSDVIFDLLPIGENLWLGTHQGAVKFDGKKFTTYTTREGLVDNYVYEICRDGDKIWFATSGGVSCYDPEYSGQVGNRFINYTTDHGLSSNHIRTVVRDSNGIMWFGTDVGINRFDPDKSGQAGEKFDVFTTKDGLSNNIVSSIVEYNGNLLLGTDKGLNIFDGKKVIKLYNKNKGLVGDESAHNNSLYLDEEGNIWFGSTKGVTKYIPQEDVPNSVLPLVYVNKFSVNDSVVVITKELEFKHDENNISFSYVGLSFKDEDDVRYQFKLEGYDKDWSEIAEKREIRYTNLNNGKYTFKVKARNGDGYWSEAAPELSFVILSPFWETWWFYLLCAAGVALFGMEVHRLRVRQLKKHKEELEERVTTRTAELEAATTELETANTELKDFAHIVSHDLKAPLRVVSQLATWISKDYADAIDKEGKEKMSLLMSRVKRMDNLIDGILQYSRAGRSEGKEEEVNLNSIVTEVTDNLAPPDNIKITIENKLPVVWTNRVRIEQVFQNLISNAIKYMDKPEGVIKISCVDEGSYWKFSVSDNGPGIEEKYYDKIFQLFQALEFRDKQESTGVGLSVVKKIVELYGGKVWVESIVGQGSTFFFTLKMKGKENEK